MTDFTEYPSLKSLITAVEQSWPDHTNFINKSIDSRSPEVLAVSNRLADLIQRLAPTVPGGLEQLCADYRFLCEQIVLPEELHFRRFGSYRIKSFEEADAQCYQKPEFMNRYMNGLLVSYVLWSNHAHAVASFINAYLAMLPPGTDHLEIGPGHGVLLYLAAEAPAIRSLTGWDISPTSIQITRHALRTLGASMEAHLELHNMFASHPGEDVRFGSIVMSEILEHLEDPVSALRAASQWLRPGGYMWVNVPANSPAPDHIFLFESPEHAVEIVKAAGLEIVATDAFPMSGTTMDKAMRRKLAISCVVTARLPD
jgi:2-polyprenyl-3-methyl-5-hydroxy-6-metoxy-1,4-benzoquinol methylase